MAAIAYLTALLAYGGLALALLFAALLLAFIPRFRPQAKWLALGVPGSFIGVFGSQLAAVPIVLALLWTALLPVGYFDGGGVTTNPFIILLAIASILVGAAFFGSVSLAGFVVGWRAANALGGGTPLRAFFASDKIWQLVSTVFRRPYRLPLLVWLLCAWSAFGVSGVRCWLNSGATVAEVPGTYRATSAGWQPHVLDISADGSWEYRREGQLEGAQAGRWAIEPAQSDSTTVVITFDVKADSHQGQTGAGFLPEADPLSRAGFVSSYVSRDCAGKLHVCFGADDRICFARMSETGHRSNRDIKSDRSYAGAFGFRAATQSTCRLL